MNLYPKLKAKLKTPIPLNNKIFKPVLYLFLFIFEPAHEAILSKNC